MVFLKEYLPINDMSTYFSSSLMEKEALPSPTGVNAILITAQTLTPHLCTEICEHLKKYWGTSSITPTLEVPEDKLLGPYDYLFLVRDKKNKIAGTILTRYSGKLLIKKHPEIWKIDYFCIHPDWRKKGLGDYLFTEIKLYSAQQKQYYAMFLKEGTPLSILISPLYSSMYVFRHIKANMSLAPNVKIMSSLQAYYYLEWYNKIYPDVMIIRSESRKNQHWRYYKNGYLTILACFQDTYQRYHGTGKRLGWCNAWLESSVVTDEIRREASIELTNTLPDFDCILLDKKWVGNGLEWKDDCKFHWYNYQWTSNFVFKTSYCIMA